MLQILDPFRDFSTASLCLRMILAFICGGIVGIEREYKRRPAGFRTHILVCTGAAMTTLTSQYLMMELNYQVDIMRLGAQVIAGIGFIGAGTIIVTKRQRIKGLTTAAGLWTTAIVGLSLGAGFYEGGIITILLIVIIEHVMSRIEYFILKNTPELNVYVECEDRHCLESIVAKMQSVKVRVVNMEVMRTAAVNGTGASAIFLLRLQKSVDAKAIICKISGISGVKIAEEL